MSEIKNLLDSIIDDTEKSNSREDIEKDFAQSKISASYKNHNGFKLFEKPDTHFDKGEFREKMSMYVLKDIISAMMHDETQDVDDMVDDAIMKHIRDNYTGSCYGYLCKARDTLKSPILGDIIQELDEASDSAAEESARTKNKCVAESTDVKKMLDGVENYEDLRIKLKKKVSDQVVDDVTKVITKSNDAPVFDDLDEKIDIKKDNDDAKEDVTNESVILKMCGTIVSESAIEGKHISTEEGMNRAIIQYCLAEMDLLFKQNPKHSIYAKYAKI